MSSASGPRHVRVLIGLFLGAALGVLAYHLTEQDPALQDLLRNLVKYVTRPIGDVFIHLLFLAVVPLVFASLAIGVTKLGGGGNLGRVGLKTFAYFILTTAFAAAIGLTLVNLVRPGDRIVQEDKIKMRNGVKPDAEETAKKKELDIDILVDIVPKNPLKAFVEKDMLAIIFTSILVGVALTRIEPAKAKLIVEFLEGVNQITDFIIRLAMSIAPYAVFALIFSITAEFGWSVLKALMAFVLTVLAGLTIQVLVVFPILVRVLGGMSPIVFFRKAQEVMVTAFSTSSSNATLPTAIRCAEEELNVPSNVSRFVLPLSATMNHNGTALFEGVTVMFLAQLFGVELSLWDQIVVLVLCVLTATGIAGVPGGSLPLIGLILARYGVPMGAVALVLGVDRILDMARTMVNVTGDLTTALFVAKSERGTVKTLELGDHQE